MIVTLLKLGLDPSENGFGQLGILIKEYEKDQTQGICEVINGLTRVYNFKPYSLERNIRHAIKKVYPNITVKQFVNLCILYDLEKIDFDTLVESLKRYE